jgi:hypothetical protein
MKHKIYRPVVLPRKKHGRNLLKKEVDTSVILASFYMKDSQNRERMT